MNLLKKGTRGAMGDSDAHLREVARKLEETLDSFGVKVTVNNVSCGPTVTRYELMPEQGVKVSRIVGLTDDIKLSLAAADVRIEAPIPGKSAVGIEVPNKTNTAVMLRDLLETPEFKNFSSNLAFAVGKDIAGQPVIADIAKMPHLLIAGATGSGKSVCINTLIMSIIYKAKPEDVKLIMIDPKVVELSVYNGIPHLFIPVVTDPKKASGALNWAVAEMTDRYNKFAEFNVRDMKGYNAKVAELPPDENGKNRKTAADRHYRGRACRPDDGCAGRSGGCDLPSGTACPCGRHPSDYCNTETFRQCHHWSYQGKYAVPYCILGFFQRRFPYDPRHGRCGKLLEKAICSTSRRITRNRPVCRDPLFRIKRSAMSLPT